MAARSCYFLGESDFVASQIPLIRAFNRVACCGGRAILIGMVCATPWFFGGVQAEFQVLLFGGVVAALACWLVKQWTEPVRPFWFPWAAVPLVGALAWGGLQQLPIPAEVQQRMSPLAAELRVGGEGELSGSASGARIPLSVYPASTRRDLALLSLGVAVFALGTALFRSPQSRMLLCGLVAVNGAAFVFFALVQRLTWDGLIYGSVPLTQGGGPFGAFVNRNNAGGYLNLSFAAAVGWTLWAVARSGGWSDGESGFWERNRCFAADQHRRYSQPHWSLPGTSHDYATGSRFAWLVDRARDVLSRLDGMVLTASAATGLLAAGVLCSLSRGAFTALVGGILVTSIAWGALQRRTPRFWGLLALAVTAWFVVSWIGMRAEVTDRLATLLDEERLVSDGRIPNWNDGVLASTAFWRTGSGLGTYRFVYRLFQQEPNRSWFYHAENQYLEALVDAGILGLFLLVAAILAVGWAALRGLRRDAGIAEWSFGIAALLALATQSIHAGFDFGLYLPANLMLLALFCGVVVGTGRDLSRPPVYAGWLRRVGRRVLSSLPAGVLLIMALAAGAQTRSLALWEQAERQTRWVGNPEPMAIGELERAIQRVQGAVAVRPDDAEARYRLAQLWIHRYRVGAWHEARRLQSEFVQADENEEQELDPLLWHATSLIGLHAAAHQLAEYEQQAELLQLQDDPLAEESLVAAREHLLRAREACALLPRVYIRLAQLSFLDGFRHEAHALQQARRLAPADPTLLFQTGVLEYQAGRWDQAYDDWQRSLALSSAHLGDLLAMAGDRVSYWDMAERVLPDQPELLVRLARQPNPTVVPRRRRTIQGRASLTVSETAGQAAFRRMLIDRAARLVEQLELPGDERHYLRGAVRALQSEEELAIAEYQRAVALRPEALDWRYELARLFLAQGDWERAHEAARYCARLAPRNPDYRKLLEEIHATRFTP